MKSLPFSCLFMIIVFVACNKSPSINPTPTNEPEKDSFVINATAYWQSTSTFLSFDLATGAFNVFNIGKYGNPSLQPIAVDSGIIYTSDQGGAQAMEIATQKLKWAIELSSPHNWTSASTIANVYVASEMVYVTSLMGREGYRVAHGINK